jgi:hypothetical protein
MFYLFCVRFFSLTANGYVLAMVGHLKNVSPTFAQMPIRITNVEFTTVSPTIANTMLNQTPSFLVGSFLLIPIILCFTNQI